jgi:outer membrane biogenesis lipoprotein LolB/Flp pilus assembly protein TadD
MFKQFMSKLHQFLSSLALGLGLLFWGGSSLAQQNLTTQDELIVSEQVFQVLAAEIALQRGQIAASYQTYLALAKNTKDPKIAQRAMEIAIAGQSPGSSLEAARLWDDLATPNNTTSREVLITLLMLNGKWEESVEPSINYLRKLNPSDREKFLLQWQSLISRSTNDDEGIRAFTQIMSALRPLPNSPELLFIYALGQEKLKNYPEMETALKLIIKKNPNDKNALNALGYSYADRNIKLPEAYALISKAYQLSPGDAYILDSLAWVNFRMGKADLAATQLRKAFEMKPEAEMGAHLGEILWSMGDKDGADKIWKKAEQINANDPTLKDTLRRLRTDWALPEKFDESIKRRWDGRFAVKVNGKSSQQGGSGAFTLDHEALNDTLEIRGPLGTSIAKVNVGPSEAILEQNGTKTEAIDADTLVEQALGLPIPARGLSAWLAGYIRVGSPGTVERDKNGRVQKILQDGWILSYTWSKKGKLEKLSMLRQSDLADVDIRLVFDNTDE